MTETRAEEEGIVFDEERAESYEERFQKIAPFKDALHLVLRMTFADLPRDARVLCVGAGTGAELAFLAEAFDAWRFTAVDPAEPMLRKARQRAADLGFADRCVFHLGTLETLEDDAPFDAATAILVSHFMTDAAQRTAFFAEIARRVRPGAPLFSADLCTGATAETRAPLLAHWAEVLRYVGLDEDEVAEYQGNFGTKVADLSAPETASIIAAAGFDSPVQVYQGLMMHGWAARRPG